MQFDRRIKLNDSGELPTDLHLFLKPKDPKSVTVGNTFSNQRLSWLACEDKLAFINNVNNDIWVKVDLSDFFSDPCMITCGEEVRIQNSNSIILMLGCETKLGGLLLFFQPFLRRIIRIVEIDVGVSSMCVVNVGDKKNPLLPGVLSYMNGIVALGGVDGSLIIVDMWYNLLTKATKGEISWSNSNWARPSVVNKIQYVSQQTDSLESIQYKVDRCLDTQDSLAYLLNDNEGELIAPKHGQLSSSITSLHYNPISAALFVGYEVGIWQMWSISDLELLYSSKRESGQGVSVVGLSVMEPSDDPRHYLYLWVAHSRSPRPACIYRNSVHNAASPPNSPGPQLYPPLPPPCQEPPFSLIYSLAFYNKCNIDSYGLLYSDFYKCDEIYEMEMVKELDNFICGRILTVDSLVCDNPLHIYDSNRDEEKEMLRVWSIVWECEFEESDKIVYVTLFDLNQWYNKIPGRPEITRPASSILPIPDTPYFATWYLPPYNQNDMILALRIHPESLASNRFSNQLDVHYYPSNISYKCGKVGSMKICQGEGLSVLSEIKNRLELQPSVSMSIPEPLMHACISIGLLPNFDDAVSIHSITITSDVARRYLLTVCIENGLRDVVLACARHWFESACTDTSISLDFLVDSLWDLFSTYQNKIDELCICLFDCSGTELTNLNNMRIRQLNEYMKIIKSVYSILIKDYSTFKKIYIVKHRHMAIEVKTFYIDLIIWCITRNILPEQSSDFIPESSIPYNYRLMRNQVAARRVKGHLLIDEMVKHWISKEVEDWGCDISTAYPPSSIQSLIHIALVAHISPSVKHFFILYFLQDLLDCLSYEKYILDAKKVLENYESYFGLREGLMRIIISFRDIDRKQCKDGIERLLDKSVKTCDLEEWEHRHIILELYRHKEYNLAFSYITGMKPSLGTVDDIKMEISLNVALDNISAGFFLTQKRNQTHPILLKHFFQECINKNKLKHVYPLPLNKLEETCFLEFLSSSRLNMANDLILYYYINRHRYAEAFVHYEKMKRAGEVGGQDSESRKRDMIMKTLESRFDPRLLLLQRSIWEAKHMSPPNGFFEEKWKPTSSYLKFDDTNPKKPLLKSSIKELAYITVWQGQKLAMNEKQHSIMNEREVKRNEVPLIEKVKTVESSDTDEIFNKKKRLRGESEVGGVMKKAKISEISFMAKQVLAREPMSPKESLDYSIIQEMISTPKVVQNKSPHRQMLTPGPASILRIKSAKKEELSSCDESSSTPRKTLKFTLPLNSDKTDDKVSLIASRTLNLEELSDDEVSFKSIGENKKGDLSIMETSDFQKSLDKSDEESLVNEEESRGDSEIMNEENETGKDDIKVDFIEEQSQTADKEILLEDRLELLKSRNPKYKSFVAKTLTPEQDVEDNSNDLDVNIEGTFVSNEVAEADEDSRSKYLNLDQVNEGKDPLTTDMENEWQVENDSVHTLPQDHFELVDNNSCASDSMDKVYTSVGAHVKKLSTVFKEEYENEQPCSENVHDIAETVIEHKDTYAVLEKVNYQDSECGDEKLDQVCDYMHFSQEDNFSKHYESESESNTGDGEEIGQADFMVKEKTFTNDKDISENEDDVICLDSDSDEERKSKAHISNKISKTGFTDSERGESLSRSSFSKSEEYSEEEYDEDYEGSYDREEMYEEEEECQGSDIEDVSDNESPDYQCSDSNHTDSDNNSELSVGIIQSEPHNRLSGSVSQCKSDVTIREDITIDSPKNETQACLPPSKNDAASHLDPSLIEKIVSFSKIVSEEQLKGLVDVVKTSINTSKIEFPLKTSSDSVLNVHSQILGEEIEKTLPPEHVSSLTSKTHESTEVLNISKECKSDITSFLKENSANVTSSITVIDPVEHDNTFSTGNDKASANDNFSKFLDRSTSDSKPVTYEQISSSEYEVVLEPNRCESHIDLVDSDDDNDMKSNAEAPNTEEVSTSVSSDSDRLNIEICNVVESSETKSDLLLSGGLNVCNEKQDILDAVKLLPAGTKKLDQSQTGNNIQLEAYGDLDDNCEVNTPQQDFGQQCNELSDATYVIDICEPDKAHADAKIVPQDIKLPEESLSFIPNSNICIETSSPEIVEISSVKPPTETCDSNSPPDLKQSSNLKPEVVESLPEEHPKQTSETDSLPNLNQSLVIVPDVITISSDDHPKDSSIADLLSNQKQFSETLVDKPHLVEDSKANQQCNDNSVFEKLQDPGVPNITLDLGKDSQSHVECISTDKEEQISVALTKEETSDLYEIVKEDASLLDNSKPVDTPIEVCSILSESSEEIINDNIQLKEPAPCSEIIELGAESKLTNMSTKEDENIQSEMITSIVESHHENINVDSLKNSSMQKSSGHEESEHVLLEIKSEASCISKENIFVDSSNEHVITIVPGSKSELIELTEISEEPTHKETVSEADSLLKPDSSSFQNITKSEWDDTSEFNTAQIADSLEIENSNTSIDSDNLNTAVIIEDESYESEFNTPGSRKVLHSDIPMDDDNLRYLDSNISVAFEVSKSSKKKRSVKKIEMVDKCVMTDRRRLRKKQSQTSEITLLKSHKKSPSKETETLTKKQKEKQNINEAEQRAVIDGIDSDNVPPRRSRRRSSSLQPDDKKVNASISKSYSTDAINIASNQNDSQNNDQILPDHQNQNEGVQDSSKPNRIIRKAVRRILKSAYSENDITNATKTSNSDDCKNILKCSTVSLNNQSSNHLTKHDDDNTLVNTAKEQRKIRKAVRRMSASIYETDDKLEVIPEDKAMVVFDNNPDTSNNSKLTCYSRSSSVPNISSLDDKHSYEYSNNKLTDSSQNNVMSKYSSNEELSTLSLDSVSVNTPRRSSRLLKPVHYNDSPSSSNTSINSFSESSDKQIRAPRGRRLSYGDESNHNVSHSRKDARRSRLSRKSTLADIIELPESDLEKSTGSSNPGTVAVQRNRRRHTEGGASWGHSAKVDSVQSAMKEAKKASRQRTHSSSSESHLTFSESESRLGDAPVHWLRSSTRSEISESTAESVNSQSIKSSSRKPMGEDLLKISFHRRRSKNAFIKSRRSYNLENNLTDDDQDESAEVQAPPLKPLILDQSPEASESQLADYSKARRLTRHQRSLIERPLENKQPTPEPTTPVATPKKRRRSSSVVSGSEDEAGTPVRSSKRLQEKAHTINR